MGVGVGGVEVAVGAGGTGVSVEVGVATSSIGVLTPLADVLGSALPTDDGVVTDATGFVTCGAARNASPPTRSRAMTDTARGAYFFIV